jgi:prepilin-type N-terminal cleavage/methylation domain-containing protein
MRRGFTLVELVVVILVVGILAAVATPKFLDLWKGTTDISVKASVSVVRDAIELFHARNGRLPGADGTEATFKKDVAPYVRSFPSLSRDLALEQNDLVLMDSTTGAVNGELLPTQGWRYYYKTGVFIPNLDKTMQVDQSIEYDEL